MATLNQLRLPDELLAAIKRRAAEHGISVEEQVLRDLAAAEGVNGIVNSQTIDDLRQDRERMAARGVHLTDDFLREAKNWGRD